MPSAHLPPSCSTSASLPPHPGSLYLPCPRLSLPPPSQLPCPLLSTAPLSRPLPACLSLSTVLAFLTPPPWPLLPSLSGLFPRRVSASPAHLNPGRLHPLSLSLAHARPTRPALSSSCSRLSPPCLALASAPLSWPLPGRLSTLPTSHLPCSRTCPQPSHPTPP